LPTLTRRSLAQPVQLRDAATPGAMPTIWGYAAVFYNPSDPGTRFQIWDDLEERIMPGAFDRAMKESDPFALFNHDTSRILGRASSGTLRLSVDQRGLMYEITPPDTATGREVIELLRRGDLRGSSFAFVPTVETERKEQTPDGRTRMIVEVSDLDLYDVGPVACPAYSGTEAGIRAAGADGKAIRDRVVERLKARADLAFIELALILDESAD
jgi:HK97 family phage prohead protease